MIRSALTLGALTFKSDSQGLRLADFSRQGRSFVAASAEPVFDDIPEPVKGKNVEIQKTGSKFAPSSPPPPRPPRPLPSSLEFESGFKVDLQAMEKQETVDPEFWNRQNNNTNKAKWWHPDPVSGVWVPEDKFGSVDSAQLRKQRLRNWPRASMDEKAWWSSLEELPDEYDRPTRSRR